MRHWACAHVQKRQLFRKRWPKHNGVEGGWLWDSKPHSCLHVWVQGYIIDRTMKTRGCWAVPSKADKKGNILAIPKLNHIVWAYSTVVILVLRSANLNVHPVCWGLSSPDGQNSLGGLKDSQVAQYSTLDFHIYFFCYLVYYNCFVNISVP